MDRIVYDLLMMLLVEFVSCLINVVDKCCKIIEDVLKIYDELDSID